ncbi:glycosyltransferase [Streptomyces bryophytorum]|uniref:glycosyltransferase family 2 protein n=1 Tax=Actinacidiphila bryophytorum TaxID=1436133 RepID=UPI0019601E99|nr:glycosyltransferase [Actinacidiphila bryophytorum]MBM9439362.1 glycosyltransferase [Actinacidiphila bryophytorum]MBN6546306.1 glycosyltransferase [Actinacidiphila bryophytorum]
MIIPTYNQADCLQLTLDSLTRQSAGRGSFEVVVVDDASVQDVHAVVRRHEADLDLRYVRHDVNRGRSAARNSGAAAAKGDRLLLMDADSIAAPDLVGHHLRAPGDTGPDVVYGRRIEPSWGTFAELRRNGAVLDELALLPMEGDHRDLPQSAPGDPGEPAASAGPGAFDVYRRTGWMFGFTHNLSLPRELYMQVGGFDEAFVQWGYEDTDFTYRIYRHNGRDSSCFRYDPAALCYHAPHFRDWTTEWEKTKPVLPFLVDKYRHYDIEFFTHPSDNHRRVARTLPFYEDCREFLRDHPGRVPADRVRKAADLPDNASSLWIGFDLAAAALAGQTTTVDHGAEFGPGNPHLFGVRTPYADGSFDCAVHLDLWRMLTPIDLSALIMDSLRVADSALLVMSKHVRRDPADGIGMIDDLGYFLSLVTPRYEAAVTYDDEELAVVRLARRGADAAGAVR